jgi:hypothetical protein
MLKRFTMIALAFALSTGAHAEILNCHFSRFLNAESSTMKSSLAPIKSTSGKEVTQSITIAGLDSKHVTAKGDIYPITLETVLIPIDNKGSHSEWFYTQDFSEAVSMIQLTSRKKPRDTIILYQLGIYPLPLQSPDKLPTITTYFGQCE